MHWENLTTFCIQVVVSSDSLLFRGHTVYSDFLVFFFRFSESQALRVCKSQAQIKYVGCARKAVFVIYTVGHTGNIWGLGRYKGTVNIAYVQNQLAKAQFILSILYELQ